MSEEVQQHPEEAAAPREPAELPPGSGIAEDVYIDIPAGLLIGFCKYGMIVGRNLKNQVAKVGIINQAMKEIANAEITYRRVPAGDDPGMWFLAAMTEVGNMLVGKLDEQAVTRKLTEHKRLVVAS